MHTMSLTNKTFDEIQIGDTASLTKTLTFEDINLFAIFPYRFSQSMGNFLIDTSQFSTYTKGVLRNWTGPDAKKKQYDTSCSELCVRPLLCHKG